MLAVDDGRDADTRGAQWARACATLFLIFSTLMVVQVQQSRFESVSKSRGQNRFQFVWEVSPFLSSPSSLLTSIYLASDSPFGSIFRSHRDANDSPTLFTSSNRFSSAEASDFLDSVFTKELKIGDASEFDKLFKDRSSSSDSDSSSSTDKDPFESSFKNTTRNSFIGYDLRSFVIDFRMFATLDIKNCPNSDGSILSNLKTSNTSNSLPRSSATPHCYLGLAALPLDRCQIENSTSKVNQEKQPSSWTCSKSNFSKIPPGFPLPSCIQLVAARSVQGLRKSVTLMAHNKGKVGRQMSDVTLSDQGGLSLYSRINSSRRSSIEDKLVVDDGDDDAVGKDEGNFYRGLVEERDKISSHLIQFCGQPIQHLLALDSSQHRLFFIQERTDIDDDAGEQLEDVIESNKPIRRSIVEKGSGDENEGTDSLRAFRGVRRAMTSNKSSNKTTNSGNDLNRRRPISKYCVSSIHLKNYYSDVSDCTPLPLPIDVEMDVERPPVHIHYDESSRGLVVFQFDAGNSLVLTVLETTPSMVVRFSVRLEHLNSCWVLASEDTSRSSILLLGDKAPYLGILHVVDLEKGKDIRVDVEKYSRN